MASTRRARAALAALATTTLVASGCGGGGSDQPSDDVPYDSPVTLVWWHNASEEGPGKQYWEKVARDFMDQHPTVTIEIEAIENETLQRTRIPAALQAGAPPPDIFMVWGGGEIIEQVRDGDYLKDLTPYLDDAFKNSVVALDPWQVDGKQYGVPFRWGLEGIFYNKELFAQAGITDTPKTMTELKEAIEKLKGIGVIPISVGAGDNWPAAHWWYNFAIRSCSPEALRAAANDHNFDDQCFIKAGELLQDFLATEPFQPDFLNTRFSVADGSAALFGNGKSAMELMGDWFRGTASTFASDFDGEKSEYVDRVIGWFPFPEVEGAPGDPTAALGGGDGWGCAKNSPIECVEFIKYLSTLEVQKGYAATGSGLPVAKGAEAAITQPVLRQIADATAQAKTAYLWLDTTYGATIGNPMNAAIVKIFEGSGTPEDVVNAMKAAAAR
ncbi:MAG: extracellular solute-binding protein [Micromonosporaceae bacterium]|nr:extracellular solute-binding protein [Micromonosporaceae bacterium]